MNKVCLVGRITRDPQITNTNTGKTRARVHLAIDGVRNTQGERQTDFIPLSAWDKTAELLGKYTRKGSRIGVVGRLRTWKHEDGDKTRYEMEVVAESVEFLNSAVEEKRGADTAQPPENGSARMIGNEEEEDGLPF